mmetsp:Transcript_29840/g.88358  ORF Transcript_29840/g.88358 Transcript_29840/m.88358 type:complete len:228 (-) Transcript_29840:4666-5349(-)
MPGRGAPDAFWHDHADGRPRSCLAGIWGEAQLGHILDRNTRPSLRHACFEADAFKTRRCQRRCLMRLKRVQRVHGAAVGAVGAQQPPQRGPRGVAASARFQLLLELLVQVEVRRGVGAQLGFVLFQRHHLRLDDRADALPHLDEDAELVVRWERLDGLQPRREVCAGTHEARVQHRRCKDRCEAVGGTWAGGAQRLAVHGHGLLPLQRGRLGGVERVQECQELVGRD